MAFTNYINNLPNQRDETIEKLAELTCSTTLSVNRWIKGTCVPPPVKQRIIADYLGKTIEELFPQTNNYK